MAVTFIDFVNFYCGLNVICT